MVPGGFAVIALVFEMAEEVEDRLGAEHFHAELFGLLSVFFAEVLDEQAQGVASPKASLFLSAGIAHVSPRRPEETGSLYTYFLAKYGPVFPNSITWVI